MNQVTGTLEPLLQWAKYRTPSHNVELISSNLQLSMTVLMKDALTLLVIKQLISKLIGGHQHTQI